jgi:hypothetical protein
MMFSLPLVRIGCESLSYKQGFHQRGDMTLGVFIFSSLKCPVCLSFLCGTPPLMTFRWFMLMNRFLDWSGAEKKHSTIKYRWISIPVWTDGAYLWYTAVTYIDSTGIHAIKEIYQEYKARNIQVHLFLEKLSMDSQSVMLYTVFHSWNQRVLNLQGTPIVKTFAQSSNELLWLLYKFTQKPSIDEQGASANTCFS